LTGVPALPPVEHRVGPEHPSIRGRSGRGVTVAIIDSGIHEGHPHVGGVAGGIAIEADGEQHSDYPDRLGHGTAVAGAIREKAPDIAIQVVKVFGRTLSTSTGVLVKAIDWSVEHGARLINLSLGTVRSESELVLWASVRRAAEQGTLIVSPQEHEGRIWLPGGLAGVAGVILDWECPRDQIRVATDPTGEGFFAASGFPRPIPGVPPENNLKGVSFAAANVTGILARLLEDRPGIRSLEDIWPLLRGQDKGTRTLPEGG
jgi:hypothetical protein